MIIRLAFEDYDVGIEKEQCTQMYITLATAHLLFEQFLKVISLLLLLLELLYLRTNSALLIEVESRVIGRTLLLLLETLVVGLEV